MQNILLNAIIYLLFKKYLIGQSFLFLIKRLERVLLLNKLFCFFFTCLPTTFGLSIFSAVKIKTTTNLSCTVHAVTEKLHNLINTLFNLIVSICLFAHALVNFLNSHIKLVNQSSIHPTILQMRVM
jgi:hypothetical protein